MENSYHFTTNGGIDAYFRKDPSDSDKYVVCTCARGENDYIKEFVDHYLNLGFDKIFICDNNDDDSICSVLSEYINNGTVEIFDCRGFGSFQVQFYAMFCTEGNYKWCAYFDCDEFLELGLYSNIKDYLATKEGEICISFNWMVFGSNGKFIKEDGGVQERFKNPVSPISLFAENVFVKSIVRGGDTFKNGCWFNGSHIPIVDNMYEHLIGGYFRTNLDSHNYFPPRYKEGYIKHYYTKSFNEWMNKAGRGWPDGTENLVAKKFFTCDDWANLPIKKMGEGLFMGDDSDKIPETYAGMYNKFDVIHVVNSSGRVYPLIQGAFRLMSNTTDHTFCFSNDYIDDTLFNLLLEFGIKTGNRVVWAPTHDDVWRAYLKYNKGKNYTYFIIDFM